MKSIAAINFRGGVGKTTITWLLAKYAAEKSNKKILVIDIDAQMSLTMTLEMEKEKGILNKEFRNWYERFKNSNGTLLRALERYEKSKSGTFDFSLSSADIYKMSDNLYFVPSTPDLYWLEFDISEKEKVREFISNLQKKIEHSVKHNYDYVFYDCPPNFNSLTYSVLSNANIILIPFNPDVLASRELIQMIEGLAQRLKPKPDHKISVLMNKAKVYGNNYLTSESKNYLYEVKQAKANIENRGFKIEILNSFIPDTLDIKSNISGKKINLEVESYFRKIWEEILSNN